MDGPDSGQLRGIHDEHAAALCRYALLLTGDRARAAKVVRKPCCMPDENPKSPVPLRHRHGRGFSPSPATRSSTSSAARGLSNEIGAADSVWPDRAAPEDVNAAVDRLLLADALAQLPADHRAVVRCAYYQGRTTAQIAADLHIAEEAGEVEAARRAAGVMAAVARNGVA